MNINTIIFDINDKNVLNTILLIALIFLPKAIEP